MPSQFSPILIYILAALASTGTAFAPPRQQPGAVPALPSDIPPTAQHYVVLLVGGPAGQQASWTTPDGALHIFFQYNDRGRGPSTTSVFRLDASGVSIAESSSTRPLVSLPNDCG